MKKMIIIEENSNNNPKLINNIIVEQILYIVCYTLVLITVSLLFDSLYISNEYFGLYALLASLIIYVLNKTIKPIIVFVTLPITALTLGLFYPLINVLILNITSFILGDKFIIKGVVVPFFIAIVISLFNLLLEGMIIRPITRRDRYE